MVLINKNPDTKEIQPVMNESLEFPTGHQGTGVHGLEGTSIGELVHELLLHKLELETHLEDLHRERVALVESRDKYLDLYDGAPLGYLTLTDKARVIDANLTCAHLFGVERNSLFNARFGQYVAENDGDTWHRYFQNVLRHPEKCTCTLMLLRADGSAFPARLVSILIPGIRNKPATVRVAVSDISETRIGDEANQVP